MGIDPDNFQGDEFWQAYMDSGEEACARGAWLEAERLFEFAIHEAERLSDRQRLVASLERQADAAHRSGNHAKSAEAIKKALELKRVDSDQEPDQVVAQLCQMALAEVDNENYPKAEALYKEAMAIVENAPAKIEPATHRLTLSSLARLYLALGHLDEAQRFFRLAIEVGV